MKLSNFNKPTPAIFSKIGNIFLIIGVIGGAIAVAPISSPILVNIGIWAAFIGGLGKTLTKLTGKDD